MLLVAPLIFFFIKIYSLNTFEIILPDKFMDHASMMPLSNSMYRYDIDDIDWLCLTTISYSMGVFIMLARIIFSYWAARKIFKSAIPVLIQGNTVFLSDSIQSPLSFGFPVARIYIPSNIKLQLTDREIQISLAHENIHLAQNDTLWKFLSLLLRAILFFAPWAYWMHRKLVLEMEIFCDEATCVETEANINEYGNLLLAMIAQQHKNLIFTNMTDSTIKRRFIAMKTKTVKRPYLIAFLCGFLLLIGSAAIAVTSGITDKKIIYKVATKIIVDGKVVSSPRVVLFANQKALIILTNTDSDHYQGLRLGVLAKPVSGDEIGIQFDVQYKNKDEKIYSKPYVIVKLKQESKIVLSSGSKHNYEMYVSANRESEI